MGMSSLTPLATRGWVWSSGMHMVRSEPSGLQRCSDGREWISTRIIQERTTSKAVPMIRTSPAEPSTFSPTGAPASTRHRRLGPVDVFVLSVCCGLAGGLLEVAARVTCRSIDPTNRLYGMSRHFVWLVPADVSARVRWDRSLPGCGDEMLASASGVAEPAPALRLRRPADVHGRWSHGLSAGLAGSVAGDRDAFGIEAGIS